MQKAKKDGTVSVAYDGELSPEMVKALEEAFRDIGPDVYTPDQVMMARRGLKEAELVAIYSYDEDNTITEVTRVNGQPTLRVGDKKPLKSRGET